LFEQSKYRKLTGRFGFEGFNRDYEVNGAEQLVEGKIKQNSFSAFTLEELGFERVKFQFGARVENNRYRPENPELLDRSFTGFSGAFGVNVGFGKAARSSSTTRIRTARRRSKSFTTTVRTSAP
jgi:hypothetical protein